MRLKLLKLNAKEAISSGATEIISSGRVIERNIRHTRAPSMRAASYISVEMACRAPVVIRNMYGNPSHRFTPITLRRASHGSVSQGMSAPPSRTWLMKPNLRFNKPAHTSPERNPGKAYGRISRERMILRPRTLGWLNANAKNSPRKKVVATERAPKAKVHTSTFTNGPDKRASVNIRVKLSNPTGTRQPTRSVDPSEASKEP